MYREEKSIHQLKKDVLLAYLRKNISGLSEESYQYLNAQYEKNRKRLEKAISREIYNDEPCEKETS